MLQLELFRSKLIETQPKKKKKASTKKEDCNSSDGAMFTI